MKISLPWKALLLPALILLAWQWVTSRPGLAPIVLPPPHKVWLAFQELWQSGELLLHVESSVERVLIGSAIGLGLGLALGFLMGTINLVKDLLYPTFKLVTLIPNLALIPLFMMFIGIGEPLKIAVIAKAAFVPMVINSFEAVRSVPKPFFELARSYEYSLLQIARLVILPSARPLLLNGMRLGFNQAWLTLVVVELLASSEGLGYLMVWGRQLMQLDLVLVGIVLVGVIGALGDSLLKRVEDKGRYGGAA